MNKIKEFFDDSPDLKKFLIGLSFISVALWVLLTIIFTCVGVEPFFEELGSALFWTMGIYLIVALVGVAGAIWSEMIL